jgi:hypothetical protein
MYSQLISAFLEMESESSLRLSEPRTKSPRSGGITSIVLSMRLKKTRRVMPLEFNRTVIAAAAVAYQQRLRRSEGVAVEVSVGMDWSHKEEIRLPHTQMVQEGHTLLVTVFRPGEGTSFIEFEATTNRAWCISKYRPRSLWHEFVFLVVQIARLENA